MGQMLSLVPVVTSEKQEKAQVIKNVLPSYVQATVSVRCT